MIKMRTLDRYFSNCTNTYYRNATSTRKKRKAIRQLNRRWTNKVVPYQIAGSFSKYYLIDCNAYIKTAVTIVQ